MATFTFDTAPTTSLIDVDSGTGTLDQLYTDIGNASIMEKIVNTYAITGPPNSPYFHSPGLCVLRLRTGVTLTMQAGNALVWYLSGNLWGSLRLDDGATLIVGWACTLDFQAGVAINLSTQWLMGATDFNGTGANPITVRHSYGIFLRHYAGNDHHDWHDVVVRDGYSSNVEVATLLWFEVYVSEKPQYNFSNITLTHPGGWYSYPIKFGGGDYSGCTFDNFTIDSTYYGIISYGSTFKMTNSTIKDVILYGEMGPPTGTNYMYSALAASSMATDTIFQPKLVFDNCIFENNDTSFNASFYATGSSIVKFKNCTAKDNDIGFLPTATSKFLYQGTTTFDNIASSNFSSSYGGANYHVQELDLTVQDFSGDPVPDATVTVKQASDYEKWTFLTNAEGQIKDCHRDNPVFVRSEEVAGVGENPWSNSIEDGRYHLIIIVKEGYQIWQRKVEFTNDLVITASLQTISGPSQIVGGN